MKEHDMLYAGPSVAIWLGGTVGWIDSLVLDSHTHIADRPVWDICTHHVFTASESGSGFNFNFLSMDNSY
jgi:hypothetical protein